MADLASIPAAIAASTPPATDNTSVLQWAVGILVAVVVFLAGLLIAWILADRKERKDRDLAAAAAAVTAANACKEENNKAWAKVEERDKQLLEITTASIKATGESARAMDRMSDTLDGVANVVRETQMHRSRP